MSLLPSKPDTSAAEKGEPRVVGVDSEDADELLAALSSETARELLCALHDDPAPPGELADRVGTSLQNAQYHLEKLEDAGAIEVVDTAYSEKGREMDVFAPADQPLVIFAGDRDTTTSIRSALTRLLGGLGLVALGSLVVQTAFGDGLGELLPGFGAGGAGGVADTPTRAAAAAKTATPEPTATGTPGPAGTPTDIATQAVDTVTTAASSGADAAAASLPPGLLFFLGGATVLVAGLVVQYARE